MVWEGTVEEFDTTGGWGAAPAAFATCRLLRLRLACCSVACVLFACRHWQQALVCANPPNVAPADEPIVRQFASGSLEGPIKYE